MSKSKTFLLVSLIFLVGNFIWLLYWEDAGNHDFEYGKFYTFTAQVKNTDKKLHGWNLVIQPQQLEEYQGHILIYANLYPEYQQGDILELSCKIYQPEPIVDEAGKEFAYDKYLAKDNIFGTCFRPRIKVIGQHKDLFFYLTQSKRYFLKNLNNHLVEPASSLSKAIILASRREIPDTLRQSFARVGLSHVVAISGLHIAIIVWILQAIFSGLGLSRKAAFAWLLLVLLLYLYLLGFPSSAVRASLMVTMVLLGPFLGRSTTSIYSLLLAANLFILFNPYLLLYDIGFQLSFLAVLGLLFYVKFFNRFLIFIPQRFKLREVMSVTLAAQVFTWPLIIYHFGIFSLIAPLANFLVLPLLPFILVLSLLLAIVGAWSWVASLVAWPLFILLKVIVLVAEYMSQIPWAYVMVEDFSLSFLLGSLFFMLLITLILKPQQYE
jgi:competence protein ComEC